MYAHHMSLSFGTSVVYDNAEFSLSPRDKVGIVGVNGAGKTTLFRVMMGEISLDAGTIDTNGARLGYLPQTINITNPDLTVWDFLMSGRPIAQLEQQLHDAYTSLAEHPDDVTLVEKIGHIQDELEYYDVYGAEDALLELIDNMKIDTNLLDMQLRHLSGGQKSKVAFARMLYSMPNILLLDEPTNHLDTQTREFVTAYLKKYKGTVLIISHDAEFLNNVVDKILFIDKTTHQISVFDGNYAAYQNTMAQRRQARAQQIESQERQIKHLNDFIQRAKSASPTNHSIKKVGHTREIQLKKILENRVTREQVYKKLKMDLRPMRDAARTPILVDNLWFRFPGQRLMYRNLSFYLTRGERFLIVGPNGSGKSTLLKLIMGIHTPERGEIQINPKTDIAYYAQELEQLDMDKTILENVAHPDFTDQQLRAVLGNFLFYDTDVFKRISILSPGERARVALCRMLLKRANMLILDEPTNHLDPETQAIIGDNFRDFSGTIIMVSHNPAFVEQIGITRMLTLPTGQIADYSHDTLEYYDQLNTADKKL
ncbi:MAG: ABC-F type ribosomal protection protein [Alphaproteobacteria bacterium]|nr:ABC-F type ribosomal protection protein [Alphaproteobacteria bacterium]